MNETPSHWGSLEIGTIEKDRGPLRNLIETEISDTRAFVDSVYSDFTCVGRRVLAARFIESERDLPWSVGLHKPGRLTKR